MKLSAPIRMAVAAGFLISASSSYSLVVAIPAQVSEKPGFTHQYQKDIKIFDLSNRDRMVHELNQAIGREGGLGRIKDKAAAGEPVASFYRGLQKAFGIAVKIRIDEGLRLLTVAAEIGERGTVEQREADLLLADIYSGKRQLVNEHNGYYSLNKEQKSSARKHLERAAKGGHPVAQRRMASYYWSGTDQFAYDPELAMYWMSTSANAGDTLSKKLLKEWREDLEDSSRYHSARTRIYKGTGSGLYDAAVLLYNGQGVPQNKTKAVRMMKDAADMGVAGAGEVFHKWANQP